MIRYTAPGVDAYYEYDASRRRISKTVNGVTTLFSWEGSRLIAELDENQRIQRRWVYRGYTPLAMVVYHYGTGPAPTGHTTYYYVTDSLGTPWRMVDASGTVVWAATYSAFGEATISVNVVDQPLRMPGQYFDAESGLHYNLARYYDPSIGRYLSVDPLRDAEDYGYAGGNPPVALRAPAPFGKGGVLVPFLKGDREQSERGDYNLCHDLSFTTRSSS